MEAEIKILSIGNFGYGWDGSICDEEHIANALEELGHEVVRLQREAVRQTDVDNIDFILIAQWDGYDETLLLDFKDIFECPIIYWAFDYQNDGQEWHERLVKGADLYLSKRIADSKYPNWRWLSQDFAPSFLDKLPFEVDKDIDVLFTGSYLDWATERNETLKAVDEKFDLRIHAVNHQGWTAQGFKNVHGPIMDEGLPELYARAKVILSIDHTLEAGYWSDRNAQIMCCGFKPLFRYIPLSEVAFKDNVEYFYDIEDCLNKVNNRIEHSDDPRIGNGESYEYAQANLKVINRVQDLLTIVRSIM